MTQRLRTTYAETLVPQLMKELGYENVHQVPKLVKISKARGQKLPFMTQVLDATSTFLQNNLVFILLVAFAAWLIWRYFLLPRPEVRLWWDSIKLKIPVLGTLFKKQIVSRFAVTMLLPDAI